MRDFKEEKVLHRAGESGEIPARKKRFYNSGKDWYFVTRNGEHHGPYEHLTDAEAALKLYLRRSGIVHYKI